MSGKSDLTQLCINTIRTLSMDGVQKADSGHPGAPMGLAPVACTLWQNFLRFDPTRAKLPNRDRFVLSNGHASMLLYSLLHLSGTRDDKGAPAVSIDDLKAFRQFHSKCPGHPEYGMTAGVETTTGPLGQGVATSVGMAMGSRWLGAHYNQPGHSLFDFDVYAICGDGDLMEGLSSEAASLAGHLRLGNLCWVYDNNKITIDGKTELTFTENVDARFRAYGWNVLHVKDANDVDALDAAFSTFKKDRAAPTLIVVDSIIGYGSPKKQGTAGAHGEPLGADEVRASKKFLGWDENAQFLVPDGVLARFQETMGARGKAHSKVWDETLASYRKAHPQLAHELDRMLAGELPEAWDKNLPTFPADAKGMATRVSSAKVLDAVAQSIPWFLGGAADLAASTKTKISNTASFEPGSYGGRNIHFGIREHAMAAAMNGLALCGLIPYGSSFLVFTDYARPAMRLSALMELPARYIFTHDSIDLGEDGPTHQPVEHLASFRAMPGLVVMRPADANEVTEAWRAMMKLKHEPVLLVLTRQNVPTVDRTKYASAQGTARGGYILADAPNHDPDVILIGTGSEVTLCLQAYEQLNKEHINARVVSLPSWDLFEKQDEAYRESVLPADVTARVAVEAGSGMGWEHYAGNRGKVIAMCSFGISAPREQVLENFGFTVEGVVKAAKEQIERHGRLLIAETKH